MDNTVPVSQHVRAVPDSDVNLDDFLSQPHSPLPDFESDYYSETSDTVSPIYDTDVEWEAAVQACESGAVSEATRCIEKLLQAGRSVEDLGSCLKGAVESETLDLVELLLRAGVPINRTGIEPAVKQNSLPILSKFIEHGWDINKEESWCVPPSLTLALWYNPSDSIISWFLENGADPNRACQQGGTPLAIAVSSHSSALVQKLLRSCRGTTVWHGQLLHVAAGRTDDEAIAVLHAVLDACQLDVNAREYADCPMGYFSYRVLGLGTALHETAKKGLPEVAEILLQRGTDPCLVDSSGNTALEVAELAKNYPVLEILQRVKEKQLAEGVYGTKTHLSDKEPWYLKCDRDNCKYVSNSRPDRLVAAEKGKL